MLGYILVTCHKNNIVTLHVTFMLYRRNETCLLGNLLKRKNISANFTLKFVFSITKKLSTNKRQTNNQCNQK